MEQPAVDWVERIIHQVLFWESDNKQKGEILRAFHYFGVYALITLIIVSHTIYPAFWLQTAILFFCISVWIQHMLTHGCVFSKVEQRLLEDERSFLDPILGLFHIEANEKSKQGILMLGSSMGVSFLFLEWVSHMTTITIPFMMQYFARAPVTTVVSALHTLPPLSSP